MATRAEVLAKLQADRKTVLDEAETLIELGKTGESLTNEQAATVKTLMAKADEIDKKIEAIQEEEKQIVAAAAQLKAFREKQLNANVSVPGMSSVPPEMLTNGKKFTIPAKAKRHQKVTSFQSDEEFTAEEKAYRFGQFCLAKASIDCPGAYRFPYATKFAHQQGLLNASHLEGGSDTTGSHVFVPEEFGTDLIKLREQYGVARRICRVRSMTSDTRTDPKWNSGLTAYFTGEGEAATSSTMQHSNVRLTAKKMTALSTYSSELNEDAVIDIGNELAREISYAFALKEDQCLISGDGTSTYGHIVGLQKSFTDNLTLGTAPGFRDTATSNTWAATVIADITTLISVVPVYAQQGMYFLCSSQYYYQVMVPLLNAAGGVTGTELQGGFRMPMFQGIPVVFSQVMPTDTATSTISLFLGNFELGVTFGDRRMETFEFSRDATVDSVNLFTNDLIAIKGSERIDINVHSYGSNSEAGPIVALSTGS